MSLSTLHESQAIAPMIHKVKNTVTLATYMRDGEMQTISIDVGSPDGNERLRKLVYWATVNGVELRLRPIDTKASA